MKEKVIIIAEAGVNHNGDINLAKKLVDVAAEAGVDYVKFQTFKAENLVSKSAEKADYQFENTGNQDTQYEMLKALELSDIDHYTLIEYCKTKNVNFLSTAFDFESIEFLRDKLDFYKIPSGEITNYPYLVNVAKLKLPIILSTGMAAMKEVKEAYDVLIKFGVNKSNITILHCNTEYPTPMEDVNLKAMQTIGQVFGVQIGYSDHTLGIEVPIAAVALGATVIEKHFTLDRELPGPDHKASLEPNELKAMVKGIRNIELALGNGVKEPSSSERKNIKVVRKSIIATRVIYKGEMFSEENLTTKRPGTGMNPMNWKVIMGTQAEKEYKKGEIL
jgi:N,N'-diacetyllegionaminate synthase